MTPYPQFGLAGTGEYDDFLCLDEKCRKRAAARKADRERRRKERRARRARRIKNRNRRNDLQLDKLALKNDARKGETERLRSETRTMEMLVKSPPPAATPVQTAVQAPAPAQKAASKIPTWALVAGGVLALVVVAQLMKKPAPIAYPPGYRMPQPT